MVPRLGGVPYHPQRSQEVAPPCHWSTPRSSPSPPPRSTTASSSTSPTPTSRAAGRCCSSTRPTSPSSAPPSWVTWPTTTRSSSRLGVEVYSVSTDTHFTHKAWHEHVRHDRQDPVLHAGRPDRDHLDQLRGAPRGSGPGRPRHVPDRPRRRHPGRRDHRGGHRPQRRPSSCARSRPPSTCARTRARSARRSGKRATRPSPRRWTSSARSDPPAAPRPPGPSPARSRWAEAGSVPSRALLPNHLPRKQPPSGDPHARRLAHRAALDLPREPDPRPSSSSPRSTRAPSRPSCARAARRDRRTVRQDLRDRVATTTTARRPSPSTAPAPTSACASPASRWATSSPRWCWRCCRSAAIRRRPTQALDRAGPGPRRRPTTSRPTSRSSCQNCPDVVQALNLMSVLNPRITHTRDRRRPVPGRGRRAPGDGRADRVPQRRAVRPGPHERSSRSSPSSTPAPAGAWRRSIDAKDAFDVLVVGGGPAGAAAAIYAARKGIRTGVAAERFGGQVLDTMAIENFISVPYTEGPKLAAALEQHVREYDVDVMNLQRAAKLVPRPSPAGSSASSSPTAPRSRSTPSILSTGARWRQMNVPGEDHYRNKGVDLLPALRRPAVQGQARRGDRRRQLGRRGGDRPRRHRRPRDADRVRRHAARRRGAAAQAAQPAERRRPRRAP